MNEELTDPRSRPLRSQDHLNDDMLQMISILITRDFDTLYPQNRKKMEAMIAAAKLEVY